MILCLDLPTVTEVVPLFFRTHCILFSKFYLLILDERNKKRDFLLFLELNLQDISENEGTSLGVAVSCNNIPRR